MTDEPAKALPPASRSEAANEMALICFFSSTRPGIEQAACHRRPDREKGGFFGPSRVRPPCYGPGNERFRVVGLAARLVHDLQAPLLLRVLRGAGRPRGAPPEEALGPPPVGRQRGPRDH